MAAAPKKKSITPSGPDAGNQGGCRPAFQTSDQAALRILLECPICHSVAKPPIHTCEDDKHLFCEECLKNLTKRHAQCPICNSPISETRSTYIEQCMDGILLDCGYREDGCQRNLKATEYREHLLVCYYREIQCFMLNCEQAVGFKGFFNHLKTNHKDKVNGIENANRHVVEWWIDGDSCEAAARWPPYFFTCFNNVFLYTAISTPHGMWEWAYILGDDTEASRFQVVSNITSSDKISELRWKGVIHPIGKPIEEIAASGLCFVTNSKEMRNPYIFQKRNNQRHYWRTDVEIVELIPPKHGTIPYILTTPKNKPGKVVDTGTTVKMLSLDENYDHSYDSEGTIRRKEKAESLVTTDIDYHMNNSDKVKKDRKLTKPTDEHPSTSEKVKGDRKSLKIADELPSTSENGKIPLSDIGNQNEESPHPKTRQLSVKMVDEKKLEVFSEEIAADADRDINEFQPKEDDEDKEWAPPTPESHTFNPDEAKKRNTFIKISDLEDDRYFESDNTN